MWVYMHEKRGMWVGEIKEDKHVFFFLLLHASEMVVTIAEGTPLLFFMLSKILCAYSQQQLSAIIAEYKCGI